MSSVAIWRRMRPRQTEKASGFANDIVEIDEAATFADDVEEIAVFAGRCVRPLARGALAGRSVQTNEHRSSWCVANVADNPVAALAPPIRKILPAHGFGVLCETACEIRSF